MEIEFQVTLKGKGKTVEEAWNNAIEAFGQDPGVPPDNHTTIDEGIVTDGDTHIG